MDKKILFLDLDGVLADFVSASMKELGVTSYRIPPGVHSIEKWEGVNVSSREFWSKIDKTNEHFWAEIPKLEWADELVSYCQSIGDTYFLTSPSRNPYCSAGKMMWIQKYYPKMRRKVMLTPNKHFCAAPNRTLIDDTEEKIDRFAKFGGNTLLFPQPWNRAWKEFELMGISRMDYVKLRIN